MHMTFSYSMLSLIGGIVIISLISNASAFSMTSSNPRIVDSFGNAIPGGIINIGQQIQITTDLTNNQVKDQPFAYLVQIQDQNGVTVSISWITGTLTGGLSLNPAQSWTPNASGTYTAQIFVFQSIDNPLLLAQPLKTTMTVVGGVSSNHNGTLVFLNGKVNPAMINDESALLMIFSPTSNLVQVSQAPVNNNGAFSEDIKAGGPNFGATGTYDVKVFYNGTQQNNLSFYCSSVSPIICTSNATSSATVELDQKVYTWTDRVYITVVAPSYNINPNMIDEIYVTVSTRSNELPHYKLVETGVDTGIFTGYVILTGDPAIKGAPGVDGNGKNPTGSVGGDGPTNGMLPSEDSDNIQVAFFKYAGNKNATASALIKWNTGEIKWLEASYPANGQGVLQIVDPDMNLNPKAVNSFLTKVWSTSDLSGINITMMETGEDTGIFQGTVDFTNSTSSGNRLHVALGDTVTGGYTDTTLPSPYTSDEQLKLTSATFIGTTSPVTNEISASISIPLGSGNSDDCASQYGCFIPFLMRVTPGTIVTWTNNDTLNHVIISGTPGSGGAGTIFNSGIITHQHSFSFVFDKPGDYTYFDPSHSYMIGQVTVANVVQPPVNGTGPPVQHSGNVTSFARVIKYYDTGKYVTIPRPYDEKGNSIEIVFEKGEMFSGDQYPPAEPVCQRHHGGVAQEGVDWNVITNSNDWGLSAKWTMPTGNVSGSDPTGTWIYYNPVNFYNEYTPTKYAFFQVDFGLGQTPPHTHGWFITVKNPKMAEKKHVADYNYTLLPDVPKNQGDDYLVDAWIENRSQSYYSSYVVQITYNHIGYVAIQPLYYTPETNQINRPSSYQDQYLPANSQINMGNLGPDKIRDPATGYYIYASSGVPGGLEYRIAYDHNTVTSFETKYDALSGSDTVELLAPHHGGIINYNSILCGVWPIPEFGSFAMTMLLLLFVSMIMIPKIMKSFTIFQN